MRRKILFISVLLCVFVSNAYSQQPKDEGKNIPGSEIFDTEKVHEIRINFLQNAAWDSLIQHKEMRDSLNVKRYLQGNVVVNGKTYYSCGVRIKGESSYDFYPGKKKSLKINFGEFVKKQKLNGLKTINLNNAFRDPSFMREKLFLDFLRSEKIAAPRCAYANVYLNNELLGLYVLVEEINRGFLKHNFGNKKGWFFKGEPKATFKYMGENILEYQSDYKNKTKSIEGYSELIDLIRIANDQGDLESVFNVEDCLKIFAITSLFMNVDSYNLLHRHNYYLYKNTSTKKFEWIPYDANYSFCAFSSVFTLNEAENLSVFYIKKNHDVPLLRTLFGVKKYREFYSGYIKELLLRKNIEKDINNEIDRLSIRIKKHVYADNHKMYTNTEFDDNLNTALGDVLDPGAFIPGLKPFVRKRLEAVRLELKLKKEKRD